MKKFINKIRFEGGIRGISLSVLSIFWCIFISVIWRIDSVGVLRWCGKLILTIASSGCMVFFLKEGLHGLLVCFRPEYASEFDIYPSKKIVRDMIKELSEPLYTSSKLIFSEHYLMVNGRFDSIIKWEDILNYHVIEWRKGIYVNDQHSNLLVDVDEDVFKLHRNIRTHFYTECHLNIGGNIDLFAVNHTSNSIGKCKREDCAEFYDLVIIDKYRTGIFARFSSSELSDLLQAYSYIEENVDFFIDEDENNDLIICSYWTVDVVLDIIENSIPSPFAPLEKQNNFIRKVINV